MSDRDYAKFVASQRLDDLVAELIEYQPHRAEDRGAAEPGAVAMAIRELIRAEIEANKP